VSIAGSSWNVYYTIFSGWKYIAYERTSNATYESFNLNTFVKDAVSRSYIQNSWYLVAVEAGFEIRQGGVGLASNSFSVTAVQDIAVNKVTPSLTQVSIGKPVNITVVVENEGDVPETFNVTAYYNTTAIDTQPVTNLAAGANETLTFTWDTAGVAAGNYTIMAEASTVPGEINTASNVLTGGQIRVEGSAIFVWWQLITIAAVAIVIAIAAAYVLTRKKQKQQQT
jgi:plastocyanin